MAEKTTMDPLAMWREWVAQSERQWNAFLNQAMATDEFSKAMGRFMDFYLNLQKGMNETMSRYLQLVNMPSRQEVLALGERLSGIEERLVRIEGLLGGRMAGAEAPSPAATEVRRPPRTKKPPAATV
ncbi:poly(R)-hydroxyalkanoic acid synthase subunit PhaE [Tepidiforma sp.]|uniref:poly(R)-hydroxyalkanoic acid synthase subunit PhaE n=1 Tax=Tepidiforma sp. TaxID=2682230 RepID=UPI002ADE7AEE|nr:poly(R)-hydroxyalkanoic acid synthase subunit PhaE [Tepidiforma sp.]